MILINTHLTAQLVMPMILIEKEIISVAKMVLSNKIKIALAVAVTG